MKATVLNERCSLNENQPPLELMELPVPAPDDRVIGIIRVPFQVVLP